MSGRIFLGLLQKRSYIRPNFGPNLWGQFSTRSYSTAQKAGLTAQESFGSMKSKLNFEQFKHSHVKDFEIFKDSPSIKRLFGDDMEEISKAYEDYCLCKYNRYVQTIFGGNPATMI